MNSSSPPLKRDLCSKVLWSRPARMCALCPMTWAHLVKAVPHNFQDPCMLCPELCRTESIESIAQPPLNLTSWILYKWPLNRKLCRYSNVHLTRSHCHRLKRTMLRLTSLSTCETLCRVLSALEYGTRDSCTASRFFSRRSLRENLSTFNSKWPNDPWEKSPNPSLHDTI